MQQFEKDLLSFSDDELRIRINNWDPRYGNLALGELTRRQLIKLAESIARLNNTIEKSASESEKLQSSNYRLQMAMLALTAITAATAVFPFFVYLANTSQPVLMELLRVETTEFLSVSLRALALIFSALAGLITAFESRKIFEKFMKTNRKRKPKD